MDTVNYFDELFQQLGVKYDELPDNYTPELFGEMLMSKVPKGSDVSYSASTTYMENQEDFLEANYPEDAC